MRLNNATTNYTHPTKESLSFTTLFKPTTSPQSERLLADSLGYPKSWHVRRVVITNAKNSHDIAHVSTDATVTAMNLDMTTMTCQDTIYSGNPNHKVDVYFNHIAAMEAALNWKEGESDGWDNKGGQLLPLTATFSKGDTVQVYYEPEDTWYDATIVKIRMYKDEVRYTVHYTDEDTTQNNITEELMRMVDPSTLKVKKGKGKAPSVSPLKTKKNTVESKTKKQKMESGDEDEDSSSPKNKKLNKRSSSSYIPKPEALQLAQSMGLPEGWSAKNNGKGMYSFRSPDGQTRIDGKRAVFKYLGMDKPRNSYPRSSKNSKIQYKEPDDDDDLVYDANNNDDDGGEDEEVNSDEVDYDRKLRRNTPAKKTTTQAASTASVSMSNKISKRTRAPKEDEFWEEEEGDDPPWRITGHEFIGKKINVESNIGLIVGWIAETDVDKNGQPGYISESDGKPSALFHVQFDNNDFVETQDFEEFEILNYLLQGK